MEEDIQLIFETAKESMEASITHLNKELGKISTGKANASTFTEILVSYYGSPTPMNQVANVSIADTRTIVIQPWEKSMLGPIEKAIFEANLGLTPMNDGELVRISIPPLTEDRRKDLAKKVKSEGEDAKVSIRNARRDAMSDIKKAVKDGYPEDAGKSKEDEMDELTKSYINRVDKMVKVKEEDIMHV
ncbi:MAG: ribosome recycling factor [Saprospiraceae bacterium]|nr:ribosome recycling factor [Saprospiraceae bacterium]